jgi:hypothetical protein
MRPTAAIFEVVTGRARMMSEAPAQSDRSEKQGDETANTHVHEATPLHITKHSSVNNLLMAGTYSTGNTLVAFAHHPYACIAAVRQGHTSRSRFAGADRRR